MITVAPFYADVIGKPSRFEEYLGYARAGRRALELTNPGARYLILTDTATARKWEEAGFEIGVAAPLDALPLMKKIIGTQIAFTLYGWDRQGLLVLPDIDAMPNRALDDATPTDCGLAITHKGSKFNHRINNLAYIRDHELGAWFLERAADILMTWPADQHEWWGDQDAWGAACGTKFGGGYYVPMVLVDDLGDWNELRREPIELPEIYVAKPLRDKAIYLYPCVTHNCPMSNDGAIRPSQEDAYFVHFKGPRKSAIATWMAQRFGS